MYDKHIYIGVVEGENATHVLKEICGDKTSSAQCAIGTIRNMYGSHKEGEDHFNAIHRAGNAEEAEDQIRLFFGSTAE